MSPELDKQCETEALALVVGGRAATMSAAFIAITDRIGTQCDHRSSRFRMSGWWLGLRCNDSMIPCFEETEETLPK